MLKILILNAMTCLMAFALLGGEPSQQKQNSRAEETMPQYLYKVLSMENWKASQGKQTVQLSEEDKDFIHFSTAEQLDRIIDKYWSDTPSYVILKVDVKKLPGEMKFEANPGGVNKYYHLYHGSIPFKAIKDANIRSSYER